MNMEMMILCDCIGQAGNIELYEYVQLLSEICEVRAIAHKDLHDSHAKRRDQNPKTPKPQNPMLIDQAELRKLKSNQKV